MFKNYCTELSSLPPIRKVISDYGLSPKKSLGQHFLMNAEVISNIAESAGIIEDTTVLEVGPGPGSLTRALLATPAKKIVAVERDRRSVTALQDLVNVSARRLYVISGDALSMDLGNLCAQPFQVVANLPYNIGTKLVINFLQMARRPEKITVMLQREVAERIVARPGKRQYGRLSIIVQWLAEARILFDVSSSSFSPKPKVESSVVEIVPRGKPLAPAKSDFLQLVTKVAFGKRRKMMRTSLKGLHQDAGCILEKASVLPTLRPEQVTIQEFCSIARVLESRAKSDGIE